MSVDPDMFQFEDSLFPFEASSLIFPPLVGGDEGEGRWSLSTPTIILPRQGGGDFVWEFQMGLVSFCRGRYVILDK